MVHLSAAFFKQRRFMQTMVRDANRLADDTLTRCETIAGFSEEPGRITRTFLCEAMHGVHDCVGRWRREAG